MTEQWFTDAQVLQVARDLQAVDAIIAHAMDMPSNACGGFERGSAAILG